MNLENLKPGDLIQAEWQEKFVIPSKNYHMLEKSWLRISERRVQQICRELEQAGLIAPVGPEKSKAAAEKSGSHALQENWRAKPHGKKVHRSSPEK